MEHIFNQILIGLLLFLAVIAPCSAMDISEPDNGRDIVLSKDEELILRLPGNPTTGFQWEIVPVQPDLLKETGEPGFVPESPLIGAGGQITFRFIPCGTGHTRLKLIYHRPWEKQKPPLREFEISVTIR